MVVHRERELLEYCELLRSWIPRLIFCADAIFGDVVLTEKEEKVWEEVKKQAMQVVNP